MSVAGFRAIAPDRHDYGARSAPPDVADYGLTELTGDLVGLLDALEIERAYVVGHDWGGFITWAMPVLHADCVLGVAALCTPDMPFPSVAAQRALRRLERVGHWAQQEAPGVVNAHRIAWLKRIASEGLLRLDTAAAGETGGALTGCGHRHSAVAMRETDETTDT